MTNFGKERYFLITFIGMGLFLQRTCLLFISKNGIVIRVPASDISVIGRNTQGVRVMKLEANDKVVSAVKVAKENNGN